MSVYALMCVCKVDEINKEFFFFFFFFFKERGLHAVN